MIYQRFAYSNRYKQDCACRKHNVCNFCSRIFRGFINIYAVQSVRYVDVDGYTGATKYTNDNLPGFDAATYKDEAVIAVAYKAGNVANAIIDTYVPEKVTGEVTRTTAAKVTVDGTAYETVATVNVIDDTAIQVESTYDFYLINGYVAGAVFVEDESVDLYGIFIGEKNDTSYGSSDQSVKIFTADGKNEIYPVDSEYDLPAAFEGETPTNTEALVQYTLNEDGELDSIAAATNGAFNAAVKTGGILNGKTLSKDVVAFYKDEGDWYTTDYAALDAAEIVKAVSYIMADDEMAAIKLNAALESTTNDTFGFVTDAVLTTVAKNEYAWELTALVGGKEVVYNTVTQKTTGAPANTVWTDGDSYLDLYKFTLNKDGEVKAVELADCIGVAETTDDFGVKEVVFFSTATETAFTNTLGKDIFAVADKSGYSLNVGNADNKNYQNVEGAAVYELTADGLELSKFGNIKAGYKVALFQTDEDAATWDLVVFQK